MAVSPFDGRSLSRAADPAAATAVAAAMLL